MDVAKLVGMLCGRQGREEGITSFEKFNPSGLKAIVEAYESEMIERVEVPVKRASTACVDANHYDSVKDGSFFTSPR